MSAMQIAGTSCGVCGSRIAADGDGLGCAPCHATYHRGCLVPAGRCRTCRADLELAAEDAQLWSESERSDELVRGRGLVLVAIALLLSTPALQLVRAMLAPAGEPGTGEPAGFGAFGVLVLFAVNLAIAAGLYFGSPGVRRFVCIVVGLECVLQGLAIWRALSDGDSTLALMRAAACAAFGAIFWVFTYSRSADSFLQRRVLPDAAR
jgi:hypothetical protein